MKIEINLKIIVFIILFFLLNNIDTYLIFLLFVFIHELAHLFCGILIGGKPRKLYLNPLGVSLEFYSYGKSNPLYKICFFIAGPLINLIIAVIFYFIQYDEYYKTKIIYTNLALCIFNLIPIIPLDGGKILKEILRKFIGIDKANKFVMIISKTFLVIISFVYGIAIIEIKNIYLLLLIIYLWYLYFLEEKKYFLFERVNNCIKNISKT